MAVVALDEASELLTCTDFLDCRYRPAYAPEGSLELGVEGRSFIYARGRGQGLFHMSQASPAPLWVWSGELSS